MAYNILVVDDSETMRAVIAKSLDLGGVALGTLFQAANGAEGLEVLRREWVDLVLADINMPVMGGVRMVEEMKADPALNGIPVVIVSTEGSATRLQALKDQGVSAFLRKPFQPEELKRTVETLLQGEGNG
ncbi:MAG: response regulator receiver protein [Fibrobacteres bacterium]|nr:response regulator receiver protein [Fibrobacterota bacterium]